MDRHELVSLRPTTGSGTVTMDKQDYRLEMQRQSRIISVSFAMIAHVTAQ